MLERDILSGYLSGEVVACVSVCGFGPIAAACHTAWSIAQQSPRRAFLLGAAGAYGEALPLGSATQFRRVGLYGIGIGSGAGYRTVEQIGFRADGSRAGDGFVKSTMLMLDYAPASPNEDCLLTVCSAATDQVEVEYRLEHFPWAAAEDMEGFGVALACGRFNVPLCIIRGISNVAGDRERQHWQIEQALRSACATVHGTPERLDRTESSLIFNRENLEYKSAFGNGDLDNVADLLAQ